MRKLRFLLLSSLLWPLAAAADPVNINTADAATLARELKGVGTARAEAIVAYRREHGPFRSVDELTLVKGIGPRVVEENRASLRITPLKSALPAPAAMSPAKQPLPVRR
jgi:competence protein ComEA